MMTTMVVVVMVAATMTAALRRMMVLRRMTAAQRRTMMVRLMEPPIPGEAMRVPALRVADRKPGTAARNQRPQHRRRLVGMTVLPVEMMAPVVTRPAAARIQAEGSGLPIGELLPAMTDPPVIQPAAPKILLGEATSAAAILQRVQVPMLGLAL